MKKIAIRLLLIAAVIALAVTMFCVASCDEDEASAYTITFVTPEGVADVAPITAKAGTAVTIPEGPLYDGYTFLGWGNSDGTLVTPPSVMPDRNMTFYAVYQQDIKYVTLTFVTEQVTIASMRGEVGTPVMAVVTDREGYRFDGWYTSSDFSGSSVPFPTTYPETDVTYYAKYTKLFHELFFDANLSGVEGEMPSVFANADGRVTIPASTLIADGMYLLGWSDSADGKLLFDVNGNVTQGHDEGDTLTLTSDMILYAQWARGYIDTDGSDDMVYIHMDNVESGIGQAVLVRDGKPAKLGFIGEHKTFLTTEFTFYLNESEGGEIRGLIYSDRTFRYRDKMYGFHVGYSHVTDSALGEMLYADGYGSAIIVTTVGDQLATKAYGYYLFDETYNEYVFVEIDPATGNILKDQNGNNKGFYFTVVTDEVEGVNPPAGADGDAPLLGYFLRISGEAGPYYLYENGEMGIYMLELNGYGWARLFVSSNGETILVAEGAYHATENYTDTFGEWEFVPNAAYSDAESFRFMLTYTSDGNQSVYLYIRHDAERKGTFTSADGSEIYMDGYGSMTYTTATNTFIGNFQYLAGAATPNLTFFAYSDEGERVATMYFDVDWTAKTFEVNNDEFVIDENGVILSYRGTSKIVVIPSEIDGITVTGIADNAFKAIVTEENGVEYSIVEVVIPAGVTHIGSLAFQNNYTLKRVTFLGEVPPTLDFATASDPFRWPAGGFVIVVPEDSKGAYVTAFGDAWVAAGRDESDLYRIKGNVEVTLLPEFEVDADGTLIAYNRPASADPDAPVDLVITVGQIEHGGADIKITAIAPEVFMGATWLRSIDLGDVTVIGAGAFENCFALETVVMPKVETIGIAAFYGCELLGSKHAGKLEMPAVKTIDASAFAWCTSLKHVVTGKNLVSLGANAFAFIKIDADLTTPFFFELTGTTPPEMTSGVVGTESRSVFAGNSAYRIVIPNIGYAIKCYEAAGWSSFCGSLYIPSGEEAGVYIGGSNIMRLDGRAVLDASVVWLYTVRNENITFYEFSKDTGSYTTIRGTISGGVITFTYEGVTYRLVKGDQPMTFESNDEKYTLVVTNPAQLDPEMYIGQKIEATLNGCPVELYINNYNFKTVMGYEEDGVLYDITLTLLSDGTFTYKKVRSPLNFTAADGSVIRIYGTTHGLADLGFKTLAYRTATGVVTVSDYTSTARTIQHLGGGMYAVPIQRGNDYYVVIVITSGDSFTYHVGEAGRGAECYVTDTGDYVIVTRAADNTIGAMALVIDGVYTETTFTAAGTDYIVTSRENSNVSYTVTLHDEDGTAKIISNA